MKIRFYLATAIVALSWMGCSQEEATNEIMSGANVIQATIESSSRSAVTDAGAFSWTTGDKISLLDESNNDTYTYSGSGNDFTPPSPVTVTTPVVAYYPAHDNHSATTFYLPQSYGDVNTDYVASTNAAMIATPPTTGDTYAFMHLGGVMRFNVKNVPVGVNEFRFIAKGKKINGYFEISSEKTINTSDNTTDDQSGEYLKSIVQILFKPLTEAKDMTFYVPLPVGTYGDYEVAIKGDGLDIWNPSTGVTNTIERRTLLLMPTFTYNGTILEKGEAIDGVIDLQDGTQSADIADNAEVVVIPGTADATATLNYTPKNDGSSVLSISDGSGATESGESEGKVLVSTADGSTVASCDINTPSLTVELSAADGGTATFEEVTALTAEQTLIIGSGVTIETLILNGGALQVADGATIGEIIVKDAATLTAAIAAGGEVTLAADVTLTEMATISKDLVLDLGGYTLTSSTAKPCLKNTATTTITNGKIVSNDVGVQNNGTLTINCDIEAVSSAINNVYGCTTTIEGGSYKSTATEYALIAVEGKWDNSNPSVIINDGTFESQFTNLSFNNGAKGAINGGEFTCTGNYYNIYVGGGNGGCDVTYDVEECSFTSGNVNVYVEAGTNANKVNGIEYTETITTVFASTVEGLTQAIARGGNVTLAADITLTEMATIEKNLNLDLGGYTLTSSTAKPCLKNTATTTITNGKIVSNDVGVQNNGTLTINCDIEAVSSAINNVYGCTTTIEGGSYKSTATEYALIAVEGKWDNSNPSVIINDGTFESQFTNLSFNNGAKGAINGGEFTCTGNYYNIYVGGGNGGCNVTYDVEECSFTTAGTIKIYVEAGTNANTVNNIEYTETNVWSSTE